MNPNLDPQADVSIFVATPGTVIGHKFLLTYYVDQVRSDCLLCSATASLEASDFVGGPARISIAVSFASQATSPGYILRQKEVVKLLASVNFFSKLFDLLLEKGQYCQRVVRNGPKPQFKLCLSVERAEEGPFGSYIRYGYGFGETVTKGNRSPLIKHPIAIEKPTPNCHVGQMFLKHFRGVNLLEGLEASVAAEAI